MEIEEPPKHVIWAGLIWTQRLEHVSINAKETVFLNESLKLFFKNNFSTSFTSF